MKVLNLIEITTEVSLLIILISFLRGLFKNRLNPNVSYFLWLFVAIRLMLPFKFILNVPEVWASAPFFAMTNQMVTELERSPEIPTNETDTARAINDSNMLTSELPVPAEPFESEIPEETNTRQAKISLTKEKIFSLIWLCGVFVITEYIVLNNLKLFTMFKKHRKKVEVFSTNLPLYKISGYNCLAGIMAPAIYIDENLLRNSAVTKNVIRHELQHYKVRDNYWQLLRTICLILQWHNPFMWWAYFASKRDCELACDARVTKELSPEEKYEYSNSLLSVLENTIFEKCRMDFNTSMGDSKKFISERIQAIMKKKSKKMIVLPIAIMFILISICFLSFIVIQSRKNSIQDNSLQQDTQSIPLNESVTVDLEEYYITNTGDPSNLYYIDENHVLWGCGRNNYGQLGNGTQDYEFYDEFIKIAENVIHVDFSQTGFTIYLTADHKLYGMGNAGCGALQQYKEMDDLHYTNGEQYTLNTPCLLMENVAYARCGRSDVACLTEDGQVWVWGTIGYDADKYYFEPIPTKVLDNAMFITGGFYNHAALLEDGSVWTWGFNFSGNCGVNGKSIVASPEKVAEDVSMIWTDRVTYNIDCIDISEFDGIYEQGWENTIIQKRDGTYFICGANVGSEEKVLPYYYEVINYPMICTSEFLPYDGKVFNKKE